MLVVDHTSGQTGGAELSLETLLANMPRSRYRFTIALPGRGPFADRLTRRGLRVIDVRLESWRWWTIGAAQVCRFILTSPLQVRAVWRWAQVIRRVRPDVVYLNINRMIEPLIAAHALGIPVVVHFRDLPSRMRYRFVFGSRAFFAVMRLANEWIANSPATAHDISPYARRPFAMIPNGLDVVEFDNASIAGRELARVLLLDARFHIVMVGGLNPWKRQADFVTMALLVLKMRNDAAFYLAGPRVNEPYARQLEDMIRQAGAGSRIRLLGNVDCVPSLLGQIDILAHTMPDESFGRVFLEAMAAERPVVAFNSGGAADIVVHGETGILVPVGAIAEMAAAVNRLLDDVPLRRRLGAAGRTRVISAYSVERHCVAVAEVWETTLRLATAPVKSS